jgi:hypothetical protein
MNPKDDEKLCHWSTSQLHSPQDAQSHGKKINNSGQKQK